LAKFRSGSTWPKFGQIWLDWIWPNFDDSEIHCIWTILARDDMAKFKFDQIRLNYPGQISAKLASTELGQVGPNQNLAILNQEGFSWIQSSYSLIKFWLNQLWPNSVELALAKYLLGLGWLGLNPNWAKSGRISLKQIRPSQSWSIVGQVDLTFTYKCFFLDFTFSILYFS